MFSSIKRYTFFISLTRQLTIQHKLLITPSIYNKTYKMNVTVSIKYYIKEYVLIKILLYVSITYLDKFHNLTRQNNVITMFNIVRFSFIKIIFDNNKVIAKTSYRITIILVHENYITTVRFTTFHNAFVKSNIWNFIVFSSFFFT